MGNVLELRSSISAALCAAAMLAATCGADDGWARHKKMFAVPVPGKVVIDGKLDDWDLSGQILTYVNSESAETESARFAIMYDPEALYLGASVRDSNPMMNRHDPAVSGNIGWDADSCQFRISVDPSLPYPLPGECQSMHAVTLTLWYYTDRELPCLTAQGSRKFLPLRKEWEPFGVVPNDLYEAKYLKADDGAGYTFEYRIPWPILGANAPLKGGDLVAGTVQFNWSLPNGLRNCGSWSYDVMAGPGFTYQNFGVWGKIIFSATGNLPREMVEEGAPPERPLPLKFSYELPEDAQITLQLMDKDNVVRRLLVAQGDRRAGKNVERWDGMDDQGRPLAPGEYRMKGIYHKPLAQKFLFSPHNSGTPPYHTDDNNGSWGGDHGNPTSACVIDGGMILAWSMCESGFGIIRTTPSGKKLWSSKHRAKDIATDGVHVLVAGDNGYDGGNSVKMFDLKDGRPVNWGNGRFVLDPPPGGDAQKDVAKAVACADGKVYVSWRDRNLIGVYAAGKGDLLATWDVNAPGRIAVLSDGVLAVISAEKVLLLRDGKEVGAIADNLDEPQGIAAGSDGSLFVSNCGALQNVSVFGKDGKYLRSIGKKGGRPALGRYEPDGMYQPGGIAVDKEGRLWVAETTDYPKRFSVWDTKTGALANEFFGACGYHGQSLIDPERPDEIYCHNVIWKIDWRKNTCYPYSTVWRAAKPDMLNVGIATGDPGGTRGATVFTAKNGRQYCFTRAHALETVALRRDGDIFKPFAAFLQIGRGYAPSDEARKQLPVFDDAAKFPSGCYFWQDANNDQTLQASELTLCPKKMVDELRSVGLDFLDEDLNAWIGTGKAILRPQKLDESGQPFYDLEKYEKTFIGTNTAEVLGKPGWEFRLCQDPADKGFFIYGPTYAKWTADGRRLWAYPDMKRWPTCLGMPGQRPGTLYGLTQPLGVAGEFTGMCSYWGTFHLFRRDGIYVGMIMRRPAAGKGIGADTVCSETFTGQLVKLDNLPGSEGRSRYFLLAGASDARVTEIFGLDTIKDLPEGRLTISDADAKMAADEQAKYKSMLAKSGRLSIARGGKDGLKTAAPVTRESEEGCGFTACAAYDEKNMYVAYDIKSFNDLINSQPDPSILFKGGNCIDIQIAADTSADPKRKTPAPGDVRILVTRKPAPAPAGEKANKDAKAANPEPAPFAVVFRPRVKGFEGRPTVLTSPTGSESFDSIETRDDILLEHKKTPSGFTAVVTIPLKLIGLEPRPGMELKMDLGYLFGNAAGNQVTARAYWANNSFSANVTQDIPNESRIEPAEWGTAVVE